MNATEILDKIMEVVNLKSDKPLNLAIIAEVDKWWIKVDNDTFAIGNKITYTDWDGNKIPLRAGEYELETGNKMMVDSSGIITSINNSVGLKETKIEKLNIEFMEAKELEKKVETLEAEKLEMETQLKEANDKIVELSEEKATEEVKAEVVEEKPEVKEEVVEEKDDISKELIKKIEELEKKVATLSETPVREEVINEKDLSWAEIQMRQDELSTKEN